MDFKDYYKTLGVERGADAAAIKKAYRKLARELHPDVNKASDAQARFQDVSEAYEVLSDPEKRKRYDELGANWQSGQEFRPPPGWQNVHFDVRGDPGAFQGGFGGFSDFFETMFGGRGGPQRRPGRTASGDDHQAEITITLEEAFHGCHKSISLQAAELTPDGRVERRTRSYEVRIPAGATSGSRIRLTGQGGAGTGGGPAGDLYLQVEVAPHRQYRLDGRDLEVDVAVSPWEAALGAQVQLQAPGGDLRLTVPPGMQNGQRLRLRGKGMPGRGAAAGDLYAVLQIQVPKQLTPRERALFAALAEESKFNPRQS